MIGADDFSFRRGQTYGTIIFDHQSGGVIDRLPHRSSDTLKTWQAAQSILPAVVTRDRSGVFARTITAAAADPVQVADRWHLVANAR